MTHADLVAAVLVELSRRGCFVWRNPTGVATPLGTTRPVRYGLPGAPDVLGVLPGGQLLGVECKVGRDRVRPDQERWHARARALGARVVVVHGVEELDGL